MTVKYVGISKMTEKKWLELRHPFIGSSDAPTLLGHGYAGKTYWSCYDEKTTPLAYEADGAIADRLWWGRQMQNIIGLAIIRKHGWDVKEGKHYAYDPDLRLGSTIDFTVDVVGKEGTGILETKNRDWLFWRDNYTEDKAWVYDEIQLSVQMLLHPEVTWGAIGVCVGGNQLETYHYQRADLQEQMDEILVAVAEFWRRVDEKDEPSITFSDIPAWVMARGPDLDLSGPVNLPAQTRCKILGGDEAVSVEHLLSEHLSASKTRKAAEKIEKETKAAILQTIGDAKLSVAPGFQIKQGRAEIAARIVTEDMVGSEIRKSSIRTTLNVEEVFHTERKDDSEHFETAQKMQAPLDA